MNPMRTLLALCLLVLAVASGYAWKATAASDEVFVAGFACSDGYCMTTQRELDRMLLIWNAMRKTIIECDGARI